MDNTIFVGLLDRLLDLDEQMMVSNEDSNYEEVLLDIFCDTCDAYACEEISIFEYLALTDGIKRRSPVF